MPTKIEWTEDTWNPLAGCSKVSEGCEHCYALTMANRHEGIGTKGYAGTTNYAERQKAKDAGNPLPRLNWSGKINLVESALEIPLHWKKPRLVFVNSMSDLFHKDVPFEFIDKVYAVMNKANKHKFQILTKRPERALEYFLYRKNKFHKESDSYNGIWSNAWYPNVWLGTSVEDQKAADERIPYLLQIPAAVRFLSCEPLLGPLKLWDVYKHVPGNTEHFDALSGYGHLINPEISDKPLCSVHNKIDWVICGGESGPGARPMHPDWARKLRDDCQAAGVPFFFKQWGEWKPIDLEYAMKKYYVKNKGMHKNCYQMRLDEDSFAYFAKLGKKVSGRLLDGVEWNEFPNSEVVREEVVK